MYLQIVKIEEDDCTIMYFQKTKDEKLIGRIKSRLFILVHGCIYYKNKVIKVRYDLLEQSDGSDLKEEQVFDKYIDVVKLAN